MLGSPRCDMGDMDTNVPNLIVITGLPGSGKTTLAHK